MKSVVAMHRETWYAVSKIKNNRKYAEYIDSVSDEMLTGGVNMDTAWEYIVQEGVDKVNQLNLLLSKDGRMEDIVKSAANKEYQKQLFQEYGLANK